jgi:hypothetical protein
VRPEARVRAMSGTMRISPFAERSLPAEQVSSILRCHIMGVAEHCTLILDGARLEKFTCAFERMDKAGIQPYGFLNGPVELGLLEGPGAWNSNSKVGKSSKPASSRSIKSVSH